MSTINYLSLIKLAKQKLRKGDKFAAKKIAQYIVTNYPDGVEGWLILGGLSKGKAAQYYIQKAEIIAPEEIRVKKALAWAEKRDVKTPTVKNIEHTQRVIPQTIPSQAMAEERGMVWLWTFAIILILSLFFLGMGILPRYPNRVSSHFSLLEATKMVKPSLSVTPGLGSDTDLEPLGTSDILNSTSTSTPTPTSTLTPTPTATPTIIPDLYGCEMELRFTSGPLERNGTTFTMIDRTYFYDKGDKFDTGKNTGLFYEDQHYLILHSGYLSGNLTNPLEIEFLRKYLELWGNNDSSYIENQIQSLVGSEMVWICDAQQAINVKLAEVVRLSHEASSDLWLNPENIFQIIQDRDGEPSEWIGDIQDFDQKSVYLGFCGWGPPEITQNRSIYYRYILRFDVLN